MATSTSHTNLHDLSPVEVPKVEVQRVSSTSRSHFACACGQGIDIRPPALRCLSIRTRTPRTEVEGELGAACGDVSWKMKLWNQKLDENAIVEKKELVVQ